MRASSRTRRAQRAQLQIPTLDEVRAERARRSLREFARQAWHVVEPATPYIHGWHADAICEHLEAVSRGEIKNLIINVPPRHMKSLLVSVFWPTWEWATHPERRWLFASYAQSLSVRDSLKCRRLIESPWYQANWGDVFQLTSDQNAKTRFDNDATGYRIATSVGGAATGEGGDRVVCDDPHSVKEAESQAVREATLTWWDEVMSTRLNDPKAGAKVVVMQRVHERDLSGHVLEQGGYEHLCLPAEYEPVATKTTCIGWRDPRTREKELLWPERFGRPEVDGLKRTLGSRAAAGQLQQQPSPAEGGIFKRHWWRYWCYPNQQLPAVTVRMPDGSFQNIEPVPLPKRFDEELLSWDMAFKDTEDSAYVVGQAWGRKLADKFLLDQVRDKMDIIATLAAVKALAAKWPRARAKLVEDKANGPAVITLLKSKIAGLIPVEPEGGKVARANATAPEVESGNVYLPHPAIAPWVNDFIEELAAFPAGAYADQVDATTQALNRFTSRSQTKVVPKHPAW